MKAIQKYLNQGIAILNRLSLAFQELSPAENLLDLTKPNNILGFQYVSAARKQQHKINMLTIERKNAHYHDEHFASPQLQVQQAFVKRFFHENTSQASIQSYIPETYSLLCYSSIKNNMDLFIDWDMYWDLLKFRFTPNKSE